MTSAITTRLPLPPVESVYFDKHPELGGRIVTDVAASYLNRRWELYHQKPDANPLPLTSENEPVSLRATWCGKPAVVRADERLQPLLDALVGVAVQTRKQIKSVTTKQGPAYSKPYVAVRIERIRVPRPQRMRPPLGTRKAREAR